MKELITRWKSESPEFWVKIKNIAKAIVIGSGAVIAISLTPGLVIDPIVVKVCSYIMTAGAFTGLSAKLTVQ